ncbi:hypothetical protein [Winogradskyella bathintestinalis]|uniref:Lipoprotein n=1 Tax=Winogradskyella bathintestinalis TaxID=3035208 RepID=A0ABT7ZRH0_9FLAO|nr:hypothetical protein [Winogradskyella bathintestinalis]MDN3491607.1 hypothetical protein [Winogradskyella bathintestinalis]
MSIVIRSLFLLCFVILFRCNKQDTTEVEAYKLISILINEYVVPIPTPPPSSLGKLEINQRLDSINDLYAKGYNSDKEFTVYLKPLSEIGKINKKIIDNYPFINLSNKIYSRIKFINLTKIESRESINLFEIKSNTLDNFENVDIVLSFSEILFNPNYDKAILKLGVSRGKLNGFSSLIICEKKNGVWEVIDSKLLNIS